MTARKFDAVLVRPEGTGTWTFFTAPFDASKEYGTKAMVQVKGTIDSLPYKGTLLPNGKGEHVMVVKKEIRDAIGKRAGDSVSVTMNLDAAPRSVAVPEDFRQALEGNKKAKAVFDALAYSHQKAFVDWIVQAKRKETRADRIGKALHMVLRKRPLKR